MERLIQDNFERMLNCMLVERRRILRLKEIATRYSRYEYTAKLRDIEKMLNAIIEAIQKSIISR